MVLEPLARTVRWENTIKGIWIRKEPIKIPLIRRWCGCLNRESHGEGNGSPLQHSCLENPMDGRAWYATFHGVAKSWTWLNGFTFTFKELKGEKRKTLDREGVQQSVTEYKISVRKSSTLYLFTLTMSMVNSKFNSIITFSGLPSWPSD